MADNDWKEQIIKERLGGKTDWTDAERLELSHRLDQEIEERFDKMVMGKNKSNSSEMADRWTEDNWKEKMAEHPIFQPYLHDGETEINAPDNALSDGLAQLKYNPEFNSPLELAKTFKDDGIRFFKNKEYRKACNCFTEGLKVKCDDHELLAQLLNNRAAAHYHLGNYRMAIKDCERAVSLKSNYRKAIQKAAECCDRLGQWDELIKWSEMGLKIDSADAKFIEFKEAAVAEKRREECITRKKLLEINQKLAQHRALLKEIENRGITLDETSEVVEAALSKTASSGDEDDDTGVAAIEKEMASLPSLEPVHPMAVGTKVHMNKAGDLVWPVLLLYPEHHQTDFIQHFNEKHTFQDQLEVVFGDGSPPAPWDKQKQYTLSRIAIYYEDKRRNSLVSVQLTDTLKDTIADKRYTVCSGTPAFFIAVSGSKFLKSFLSKYKK